MVGVAMVMIQVWRASRFQATVLPKCASHHLTDTFGAAERDDAAVSQSKQKMAFLIQIQSAAKELTPIDRGTDLAAEEPAPLDGMAPEEEEAEDDDEISVAPEELDRESNDGKATPTGVPPVPRPETRAKRDSRELASKVDRLATH